MKINFVLADHPNKSGGIWNYVMYVSWLSGEINLAAFDIILPSSFT